MKKLTLITCICMSIFMFGSCRNNGKAVKDVQPVTPEAVEEAAVPTLAFDPASLPEEPVFKMETTMGTMTFKLYKDTPLHRDNFVKLASEGFYNNLLFHRVINGFMIQGGDPNSRDAKAGQRLGSGGPGYTVPAEFKANLTHTKGAIAAARTGDAVNPEKASSGCQFYIVQDEVACSQLNGNYTVYGQVIDGLDVIDKIAHVETAAGDRPVTDVKIISITPVL